MNIIFDIGANDGQITKSFLRDSNNFVYSFEPIPERFEQLKLLENTHQNLKVYSYAVSNEDTFKDFHINYPDVTSSLKEFTNLKEKWHADLSEQKKITVEVCKLSTFFEKNNLQNEIISFIKIDTQGSDFDVVLSLGDYLKNVKRIQLECFINEDSLYVDECKCNDIKKYLNEKNFKLESELNHGTNKWADLTFVNLNL